VLRYITVLVAAMLLASCGQKASTRTTAITPAPIESGALPAGHGENSALASSPSDLHCGNEPVVWVNERSKVYHTQSDPYYGHTKSGGYMCELDAVHAGYHAAKK
jgi:hypothetical protein